MRTLSFSKTFLVLRRTERGVITMYIGRSSCTVPDIVVRLK